VARVELAPEILDDLDRIFDHLAQFDPEGAAVRIQEIVDALDVLERNPLIGRPTGRLLRELVIGKRARGYLALYRYVEEIDIIFVLAIRSQREAGYRRS
jgi:toxin ParE1/3/4